MNFFSMLPTSKDFMEMMAPTPTQTEQLFSHLKSEKVPLALALLDDHSSVLDLAKRNSSGYTCMHVACANGCSTVAERIVARRPESLNEPGGSRASTPLHMAAGKGHPDTVSSLLALGADRKIVDKRGRTPEDCSVDPLVKGIFAEDTKKRAREATYTHADGTSETVNVVKKHSEAEGGGYSIFVPSLGRERQTVDHRLAFGPDSMYYTAPKEPLDGTETAGHGSKSQAEQPSPALPTYVPPPPLSPPPEN